MSLWLHHVAVRVPDLDNALHFHQRVLGLSTINQEARTAYLGCGYDPDIDLCLVEGGTGLDHVAYAVTDESALQSLLQRLRQQGIVLAELSDPEPGIREAMRFTLPSGHSMEFVVLSQRQERKYTYPHPCTAYSTEPRTSLLLDLDHVTLRTPDVQALAVFLRDALGFHIPDVRLTSTGRWRGAWLHSSIQHHDLAILQGEPSESLDHVAFRVSGIEVMKLFADLLAIHGRTVEVGPGRHSIGGNLFLYFWTPDGNRYELSAEMALIPDRSLPTTFWGDSPDLFSPWGMRPPESFRNGS
jgi:catechol 2,3-dioxygenase